MMYRILLFFCLIISGTAFAQKAPSSSNRAAQRSYELANQHITNRAFERAVAELKKAVAEDDRFIAAYQQLGDLQRRLGDHQQAVLSYRKVIGLDPEFYRPLYFGIGESELLTGDYQNALSHFKKYASYPGLSVESKARTAKYINDCLFSIEAVKDPVNFMPVNMGPEVNSLQDEYLPVVTADESTIIFTRKVRNNEDFYTSSKIGDKWSAAKSLSPNINTFEFNEGAQCISPDGNYLFFTGCNRPDGLGRCDIYISRREGDEWSSPFNIGGPVNTSGWESQPSISADGKTLYFVSTRNGGQGGYDIWKSELKESGGWDVPVNLGPDINTPYDEQSPFIHPDDQTLYFSSNGWPGMGSKDLFMSRKLIKDGVHTGWEKAKNLGYPINTHGEETGLTVNSSGRIAYYASNQNGSTGGLDIYSFEMPEASRPKPVTYVKGRISDKASKSPLDAKIRIINLNTGAVVYDDVSDDVAGEFLATLLPGSSFALNVSKEGYLFYSQNFTPGVQKAVTPYRLEIPLQKIEVGALVVLNNIFFDTNKYDLLPESKTELGQLIDFLMANPDVRIEIGGHTDNIGDEKSNQVLSENRAKTVYDHLVASKVPAPRLSFKGYGENSPLNDNSTDENRKNNRRTEFRIIGK